MNARQIRSAFPVTLQLPVLLLALLLPLATWAIDLPVQGKVTMIDLGAHSCIPCKMMAPVLSKLKQAYEGRAVITFIDVWEQHDQGIKYGVRSIPTQIFYDREGQEVFRHAGFMAEKDIVNKLTEMGVAAPVVE
ncbi:MAG: thiol reductase thioredoxin [Zetaproteobacteria bacterium CG2_30_46_52]|nr:MAG: thiol reductase thioredoxin [Zetaproteobacteria bacterium CG2_30_46_52]